MPKLFSLSFAFGQMLFAALLTTFFSMPSHATPEPEYQVVKSLANSKSGCTPLTRWQKSW
jgi:hypothetical protein